jgi:hypothetical protein
VRKSEITDQDENCLYNTTPSFSEKLQYIIQEEKKSVKSHGLGLHFCRPWNQVLAGGLASATSSEMQQSCAGVDREQTSAPMSTTLAATGASARCSWVWLMALFCL